jgi:hypothetical protein
MVSTVSFTCREKTCKKMEICLNCCLCFTSFYYSTCNCNASHNRIVLGHNIVCSYCDRLGGNNDGFQISARVQNSKHTRLVMVVLC